MMPIYTEFTEQEFPEAVVDALLDDDYGPDNSDIEVDE
jgi:hypothetical protein